MTKFFLHFHCPKDVESRFSIIVFDRNGNPFMPLTYFYDNEKKRLAESSALNYLNVLIPFFSWLRQSSNYMGKLVAWDDGIESIRTAIKEYLSQEMYCKVRPLESFELVHLTRKSPNTINCFLAAVKSFYFAMIRLKLYSFTNPLVDLTFTYSNSVFSRSERKGLPKMPSIAGTEKPSSHSYRQLTNTFFKIVNEEWKPAIIDDITLPSQVYEGGKKVGWRLRDEVITRLLFETGARATEVIEITIGDYRSRTSIRELSTFNKGSNGRRTKFLLFSDDTYTLLKRYINSERIKFDRNNLGFDELEDNAPVFLSERGTPYTYIAWYNQWRRLVNAASLKLNPHKTRHWYVTNAMRLIYETSQSDSERDIRLKEFVRYMKWKSKDTIKVYEHYFNEKEHITLIDEMHKNMKQAEQEYKTKRHLKNKKISPKPIVSENKEVKDFFKGLEG